MSGPDTALQARAVATNTARRNGLLLAVIVTGTLLGIIWSYARLSDGRRTAVEAAEDLGACRDLAARVNALLSFLYALLTSECVAALEQTGLDPQVGYLHALRAGRPALALELELA